jgi:hypothetical protein
VAEVAKAYVTLIPQAKGFGRATDSAIGGELDGAGKRGGKRFGGGMVAGVKGFMGPLAAVIGGAAVLGAFNNLTGLASDFNETINKSQVIFGKQAGAMEKWASGAAKNLGLSQSKALAAAAGFGDMFSQIGFGGKAAADMSQQVVQAAADLGSFSNLDTADVSDRIAAAFRGEYDSLQAVIPNINAARVEQEALATTGKKSAKSLTAQEKAAAVLAIVQKDGARAMGDFSRTSDGAANKAKIQAARWEDLRTKFGGVLLPLKQLALDGFGLLITGLEKLGPILSKAGEFFSPLVTAAKDAFSSLTAGGGGLGSLLPTLTSLGKSIASQIVPTFQRFAAFVTTTLIPALKAVGQYVITKVVPIFTKVAQIIATQVVPIIGSLARFFIGTLVPAIFAIYTSVASKLKPVFDALVTAIMTQVLPTVQSLLAKFREWLPTIQKVITVVVAVVGWVLKLAAAILAKVLPIVIKFAVFLLVNMVKAVAAVIGIIIKIIGKVIDFGIAVVGAVKKVAEFVKGVKDKFGDALTYVKGIPGKITSALGDLGSLLLHAGEELMRGLARGIGNLASAPVDAVKGVASRIKGLFGGSPVEWGPLLGWNNGGAGKNLIGLLAKGLEATGPVDRAMLGLASGIAATPLVPPLSVPRPSPLEPATSRAGRDPIDYDRLAQAMSRVQMSVPVSSLNRAVLGRTTL